MWTVIKKEGGKVKMLPCHNCVCTMSIKQLLFSDWDELLIRPEKECVCMWLELLGTEGHSYNLKDKLHSVFSAVVWRVRH